MTMKEELRIGILVTIFFIAVIGGSVLFLNTGLFGASYPIDSRIYTTLERTVIPVPVPLTSPALLPYQVSNYSEYGYGAWRLDEGVRYEKRLDLMPASYATTSVTNTARLLNFFAMTDIHITDKESPAQAVYYGFRIGEISCPAKYFEEASSINFSRSVKYGFGVLGTTLKYVLQKWGLAEFALFNKPGSQASRSDRT
jgi:hypothetical protein